MTRRGEAVDFNLEPEGSSGKSRIGVSKAESVRSAAERIYPELFANATKGPASLVCIARARQLRLEDDASPQDCAISHYLETAARETFAKEEGRLQTEYWAEGGLGVAALTQEGKLFSLLNTSDIELVSLEEEISQLDRDARKAFRKDDEGRLDAAATLFPALARVLVTAEALAKADASPDDGANSFKVEAARGAMRALMKSARTRVSNLIQRQARFEYFQGVLLGALITIGMISGLAWLSSAYWSEHISTPGFVAATIAGAIGAVVSVTQRMAKNALVLDYTASPFQKRFLGGIRALMGSVFGAIIYFALLGGFLTVNTNGNSQPTPATFAFFALAGFAAGFSERLATDVLERAGKSVAGTGEKGNADGPEPRRTTSDPT